jgi:hypothetical protein
MITAEELHLAARLPLLELGRRANAVREAAFGDRVYFCAHPATALELAIPSDADLAARLLTLEPSVAIEPRIIAVGGATTGEAEIRLIALARLALPPTVHVRANWTSLTDAIAQVALRFGADELSGFPTDLDRREIWRVIRECGREPYPCNASYEPIELPEPGAKLHVLT